LVHGPVDVGRIARYLRLVHFRVAFGIVSLGFKVGALIPQEFSEDLQKPLWILE